MTEANQSHRALSEFSMYLFMLDQDIKMFQSDRTFQVPPNSQMLDAWGKPTLYPLLPIHAPVNLKINMLQSFMKDLQNKKRNCENDLKMLDTAINKINSDLVELETSEEAVFNKTLEKAKQLFDKDELSEEFVQALEILKKAVQ